MSMILDALTRAEHERQLEKEPDLKFVTPVKPKKAKFNNLWLWVGLGVLANVLILFFVVRALTGGEEQNIEMAATDVNENGAPVVKQEVSNTQTALQPQAGVSDNTAEAHAQAKLELQASIDVASREETLQSQSVSPALEQAIQAEGTPLVMEINTTETVEVDRPLLYESKQPSAKPKAKPKVTLASATAGQVATKKKGNVSFSSSELTADDAIPVTTKPKLLIDQGSGKNNSHPSSSNVPNVRDLPESSRTSLNQYEVNVHVFDDDPIRRFVLINMDKYKEGDRIANNGPLVQEITVDGVVVDYGSGRALLPPK